jgi:hypothetical protein
MAPLPSSFRAEAMSPKKESGACMPHSRMAPAGGLVSPRSPGAVG